MTAAYTRELLRLAAAGAARVRLAAPTHSATRRTQSCGSVITLDLNLDENGRVCAVGYDIHACAFGQAAAELFADGAIGRDREQLQLAREQWRGWLADAGDAPAWPGAEQLAAAVALPGRQGAVLLPFDAALDALADGSAQ